MNRTLINSKHTAPRYTKYEDNSNIDTGILEQKKAGGPDQRQELIIGCLIEFPFTNYTLVFIQWAFYNFPVKWLLQYKTKHVSVTLQKKIIFHQDVCTMKSCYRVQDVNKHRGVTSNF